MSRSVADQLRVRFGLDSVDVRLGLSQDELFAAAVAGDRGRTRINGGEHDQKAFATALGAGGPLIFYSDPSCTGRPVQDTFAVAWPEVVDDVWWKADFSPLDGDHYDGLLARVLAHLNESGGGAVHRRCVLRLGPGVRHPLPAGQRVRHPRLLRQHHVPQGRAGRRRPRGRGLGP